MRQIAGANSRENEATKVTPGEKGQGDVKEILKMR